MTQRNVYPKTSGKKEIRTVYYKIRISPEEDAYIRKSAAAFGGISDYVRSALAEFSNPHNKAIADFMNELGFFYFNHVDTLQSYGDCLNSSVKRVNELAKAGRLTVDDIERGPLSYIKTLQSYLTTVKTDLDAAIENTQKNGVQIRRHSSETNK